MAEKSHSGNGSLMPIDYKMETPERQKEEDAPARQSRKRSGSAPPAMHADASIKRSRGRVRLLKVLRVLFRECCEIFRYVCLCVNRVRGANRNAGAAVNAVYRVDVELLDFREFGFILPRMNAINRANLDALLILCTAFNDYE
jgi:hypothetical protein